MNLRLYSKILDMGEDMPDEVYRAKTIVDMAAGTPEYNHIVLCSLGKGRLSRAWHYAGLAAEVHKKRLAKHAPNRTWGDECPPEARKDANALSECLAQERELWRQIEEIRAEAKAVLDANMEYQQYKIDCAYP